ncbi:MAG: crotonase [Marine Group III euryarchaeote CG-Epi2]|uniref:Crotonase n=1 Tax=Marine Group III euryarchaeote CG-Epi2 TaxID=1888996 RepID=A0A1J5U9D9_9ARCH|nr:MAG: crotonase [Marine Group III euryarchaeote CG-Epi2]|tara:strand:+ start:1393 stop:2166 length:774 start_codon:yes stop_codon:yes gene_type:complete
MTNVLIERKDNIGIVTVNRPEQMNSLNSVTRKEMAEAFTELGDDSEILVIILTGAPGKAFIAGADIKEFLKLNLKTEKELKNDWLVTEVIENLKKPVIAMIDGFCLGGGLEIAMSCDLRVASDRTKLGQPEINIGIIPGAGGTQRLTRLVGEGRAMEMILTGRMVKAEEGLQYGILNFIFTHDELEEKTMEMAKKITEKSPYAIERAKQSVKSVSNMNLREGLKFEREMFLECFTSDDGKEGITAFIEKRKANFKGK